MLCDERLLQSRQPCLRVRICQELIRIGAPLVTNGNRFAAPNQFRSTPSESLPAPKCMFAGIAFARSIPPFHRLYSEAIANPDAFANDGLRQRRLCSAKEFAIAWNR